MTASTVLFIIQSSGVELNQEKKQNQPGNQLQINKQVSPPLNQSSPTDVGNGNQTNVQVRTERDETSGQNDEFHDYRVPFWNIAHMINAIENIETALREGANGIETDISFDKLGRPAETYHGFPCDCGRHCHFRENFITFIKHIAQITNPPFKSSLLIVVLDLKLKDLNDAQKVVAGKHLAMVLDEHLYRGYINESRRLQGEVLPPLRVIVSINHVKDHVLVRAFLRYMGENQLDFMSQYIGFDVGMNDNLDEIQAMWNGFGGVAMNIWQGDGLTNCANIIRGVERVKNAINVRNNQGHFRKIYYWTADVMYHIRSVLRLGVDAMLTNQPERVVRVLNEPEFIGKFRLATAYDDPFSQFFVQPSSTHISPPTLGEAVETITNLKKTTNKFVQGLPEGVVVALGKVQEAIASRLS